MNKTQTFSIPVPLVSEAHRYAKQFSDEQATSEAGKRVYFNTLAVYAVHSFLQLMEIPTDFSASVSWHPVKRRFEDVADLFLPELGSLECRPLLPGETVMNLPSSAIEDRIGYVAVQFQQQLNEALLVGFIPALEPGNNPDQIPLTKLQPLENLIDYLYRLEVANEFLQGEERVAVKVREKLIQQPLSKIVAQLERIFHSYDEDEWRYAGGDLLAGCVATGEVISERSFATMVDRGSLDDSQQLELQDLAEELLGKLNHLWSQEKSEDAAQIDISSESPAPAPNSALHTQIEQGSASVDKALVNMSNWFQDIVDSGWQTLESFLSNQERTLAFRFATASRYRSGEPDTIEKKVERVKLIELGGELKTPLALMINVELERNQRRDILFQLYPTSQEPYLPPGVKLIILDETGDVFLEAQARNADNWIQLQFRGEALERFSVKIALGDASVTEEFVI